MNIYFYFYFNIGRDFVTDLLLCVDIYHYNHTFPHAYTEAHTHKHTCMTSAQNEWREPGIRARLKGAKEEVLLETKA